MSSRPVRAQRTVRAAARKPRATTAAPRQAADGSYYFVVDAGQRDGKRRQAYRRGFKTIKEAQEALDAIRVSVTDRTYTPPKDQTFERYLIDDWLPGVRHELKPSTWVSYERYLRLHVTPRIGQVRLDELEPAHLDRVYNALRAEGSRKDKNRPGTLSPRTVRYIHTIIRAALADAVVSRRLKWNPADAAKPGKASADPQRVEMRTWSAEQLSAFLGAERETRYGPLWVFLALTGCRRGEALGLRWSDVADDYSSLTVQQTLITVSHPGGRTVEFGTPKTHRPRVIDMDARTASTLRALRASQAQERLLMGGGYAECDLVFALPDGRTYHPERVSREFDRRIARHGLERIRLHDLRHTWATLALRQGVDVKIVSERLGHSTTSFTRDVYMHVTPVMQTEAAEKVSALVDF